MATRQTPRRAWRSRGLALALLVALRFAEIGSFHIVKEPLDITAPIRSTVVLDCTASNPSVSLAWRYSTTQILEDEHHLDLADDQYRTQLSNGSLQLYSIGDGAPIGNYQCVCTDEAIGKIVSRVATVNIPTLPGFISEPRDLSLYPGQSAFFTCAVRGTFSTGLPLRSRMKITNPNAHNLKIQWLKNETSFVLDESRMSVLPSGALEIDLVTRQDQGSYQCNVSLLGSMDFRISSKGHLSIKRDLILSETITAPRFIAEPRSQTVVEGSAVTLDCAALGNPNPDIIWLKNGANIDLNLLDSRFQLLGPGVLYISSIQESDSGHYQCRADNREESLDSTAVLEVQVPPRFIKKPSNKVAMEREDIEFECEVYGKPEPTVRWLKNSEIITPNNHEMAFVNGYNLRIQGLLIQDAGIYQCVATNIVGNIQASARLEINTVIKSDKTSKSKKVESDVSTHQYYADNPYLERSQSKPKSRIIPNTHDIFNSLKSADIRDTDDTTSDYSDNDHDSTNTDSSLIKSVLASYPNTGTRESDFDGVGLGEDDSDGERLPPSEPLDLRAVIIKPRFVTLSWNEPLSLNGDIEAYTVLYKISDSERERMMNTTRKNVHEMNISQLQPNTAYQFRVVAYNKNGAGKSTQVLDITTQSEDQYLGPPTDFNVTILGPQIAEVSWQPPYPVPGAKITVDKYQLFYSEIVSGDETYAITSELKHRLTDLRPFTEYAIRAVALPVGAEADVYEAAGAPTEQIVFKTPGDSPSAPPLNVTLESQTSTTMMVNWEAPPIDTQNGDITGYKIKYKKFSKKKAETLTTAADVRNVTLKDLDRKSTYQVRICAFNINGTGPYTNWSNVDTLQNDLDESQVPDVPSPLKATPGSNYITVSWAPPRSQMVKIRGYSLGWGKGVPDEYYEIISESIRYYTIRNLEQNSDYVISLRATNKVGDGQPVYANVKTLDKVESVNGEDSEYIGMLPGAPVPNMPNSPLPLIPPVGLKADILSDTTAVLYWTDTTLPKSQIITDQRYYVVRYCSVGSQRHKSVNCTNLNCMIDELKPNTPYEFTVKVVKGLRESPWSMVVVNNTLESSPASPPRDLTVSKASDGSSSSLQLQWQPPYKANGVITGYVISYTTDRSRRDREWIVQAVVGGGTSALVRSLKSSTTYHFKVQARNALGYGPFSPTSSFTTPEGSDKDEGGMFGSSREPNHNHSMLMYSIVGTISVVVLAGVIIMMVICCRRSSPNPPTSPDSRSKSTYQKSSASNIKPPDLWIHHDQMELKQMDKSHHGSSGDGGSGMSSMSLPRPPPPRDSCEYETTMAVTGSIHHQSATGSLDKRHYVPTYVAMSSINACRISDGDTIGSSTLRSMYPRTQYTLGGLGLGTRNHMTIDQNTPLLSAAGSSLSGTLPSQSSMSSLGQIGVSLPMHNQTLNSQMGISPMSCSQASCGIGTGNQMMHGMPSSPSPSPASEGFPADAREREQGNYVAYEALHPPRDSLEEASAVGSLGRTHGNTMHPLRSFSVPAPPLNEAPNTPHHHNKVSVTIRPTNTSPYKKPFSNPPSIMPGGTLNRLQQGTSVSHSAEEVEALAPSHSTERLHQEMANLEGLMKDLNAITANQFEC